MPKKAKVNNWTRVAAQNILLDLKDRRGIGNAIEECDEEIQQEIEDTIVELIEKANKEATDDANTRFP